LDLSRVIDLKQAADTTTAGGRLIFHIFGALAEFRRSIIRERTLAGLEAARASEPSSRSSA
jgi:DNA invertase Pin-like site-specific DNA recombinase